MFSVCCFWMWNVNNVHKKKCSSNYFYRQLLGNVCHNLVVITLVTKNIHNRVKWSVARLCSPRPSRHSIFPSDLLSILIQFREALADFFVLLATQSASQIVKFEGGKEIPLSSSWLTPRPEQFAWENQFPPSGCKLYCSTLKEEKLSRAEDGYNFRKL